MNHYTTPVSFFLTAIVSCLAQTPLENNSNGYTGARYLESDRPYRWYILPRLLIFFTVIFVFVGRRKLATAIQFAYNCFFKTLGKYSDHQSRLNAFYTGQEQVYDSTRDRLLRGRKTMLRLCAAELATLPESKINNIVWVDIGGGTGWNIEQMNRYFPVKNFGKIYLVDLCQPLCKVAKQRFKDQNWSNVSVLCQDALTFSLPDLERDIGKVDLITMSYSLSMIENFYPVINRLSKILDPITGVIAAADFYISDTSTPDTFSHNTHVKSDNYRCNWFTRVFWQHWFEFDHVYLHPSRRNYLEFKFSTKKVLNLRNHFIIPYLIQIPYYIWIGHKANCISDDTIDLRYQSYNETEPITPVESDMSSSLGSECRPIASSRTIQQSIMTNNVVNNGTDSVFNYNIKLFFENPATSLSTSGWRRIPYNPHLPQSCEFGTYIYGFTWEDPQKDIEVLDLRQGNKIMVITSAGDNALAYAIAQEGLEIHCVDMNPCQNHLFELKLTALYAVDYPLFWEMFGRGKYANFKELLDIQLSTLLSPMAYQYWKRNVNTFASEKSTILNFILGDLYHRNLYTTGYTGLALHFFRALTKILGIHKNILRLTNTQSLAEQSKMWLKTIRDRATGILVTSFLDNPVVMWKLLGVPINQLEILRKEGTMQQYMLDTVDPVITNTSLANDNYFYRLLFCREYTRQCCPDYLTQSGFETLKQRIHSKDHTTFHLHTSTILAFLEGTEPNKLDKAVIMDHMDWFTLKDAKEEILALKSALKKGGFVLWRSAAQKPWYAELFSQNGFKVKPLAVRTSGSNVPLDRVNMYASFYKATKL